MDHPLVQLLKKIAGVALIIMGVISAFIPIIQGWIFVVAGLLLLGVKKETIKGWIEKFKNKFKKKSGKK